MTSLSALGQEDYRRSSLYSILVRHPEKYYDREIDTAFASIPIPHKFNDHSLKIKAINCVSNRSDQSDIENVKSTIDAFITKNQLGKRLVAKWFNRKQGRTGDGTFDMNLVIERGLYDADYFDLLIANQSIRGHSVLADAGEDLIGNTFVLFNDIRYLDKEEAAFWASMGVILVGAIASELTGGLASLAISAATNASVRIMKSPASACQLHHIYTNCRGMRKLLILSIQIITHRFQMKKRKFCLTEIETCLS